MKFELVCLVSLAGLAARCAPVPPQPVKGSVSVDFTASAGRIKPLHGVNNAPVRLNGEQAEFRLAGIPYVRLHDTCGAFGGAHYVDIPNIFPDFDADENDPAAYDFAFTDAFLRPLVAAGCQIFYRLGCTIELNSHIRAYGVKPPKDFKKWARVCEHVVRHYNCGWANGFRWNIVYWEFWNEPEGRCQWHGTREQFYELYGVVANHLKASFPDIKIGAYGSCGFYGVDDPENKVGSFGPEGRNFVSRFVPYFEGFLSYCANPKTKAPLDFFSWHFYYNNEVMPLRRIQTHAKFVRDTLDRHGFTAAENVFDEWNARAWGYGGMKELQGANFCATMFCLLQDSSVDLSMYYDALPSRAYCGLFYYPDERTTPCFEAFRAWNELYRLGGSAKVRAADDRISLAAATDGRAKAFLLVNGFAAERVFTPEVAGADGETFTLYRLDDKNRRLAACGTWRAGETMTLPPTGLVLAATDFREPVKLLIAGDSTLAERPDHSCYGSWGQQLAPYLKSDVYLDNLALSGRSTKSFRSDGSWERLVARVRTNDFVIVSFGINDLSGDPRRKTSEEEFRVNMARFADEVRTRGGRPVFVSTTPRYAFEADGKTFRGRADLERRNAVTEALAAERGVPFVDLYRLAAQELATKGRDASRCYYLIERNGSDTMHPTVWGAKRFARLFRDEVKSGASPLAEIFR